jgi:hypothetical protein
MDDSVSAIKREQASARKGKEARRAQIAQSYDSLMGTVQPSYLGSQSTSPTKEDEAPPYYQNMNTMGDSY